MKNGKKILWFASIGVCVLLLIFLGVAVVRVQNKNRRLSETETVKESEQTETESEELQETETEQTEQTETEEPVTEETEMQTENTEEPTESFRGIVAIDPGHQGSWVDMSALEPNAPGSDQMKAMATTGTQGRYTGIGEYQLNLDISLLLRAELEERGYQVVLTREDNDTAISNAQRAQMANESGADIYLRIHANGSEDGSVNGALAMVPGEDNPYVGHLAGLSYELADDVLQSYCSRAEFANRGIMYENTMTGINWSQIPVMILEMGFMTNESDDVRMADADVRVNMVLGIADGVDAYFAAHPSASAGAVLPGESSGNLETCLGEIRDQYINPAEVLGERWAVSVCDLTGNSEGDENGDVQMQSASVIKLFIMAAVYDRVCYPSSEERWISFPESYDGELKQLITSMITVSDNEAANTIVERLGGGNFADGMEVVNNYCRENGYLQTTMGRKFLATEATGDNYTSANDCRGLLRTIYEGRCVNEEASAKMMEYLKNQTRLTKIPAGIPDAGVMTANKTGELYGDNGLGYVENDVAIVWRGGGAYILCVLSDNLNGNNASAVASIQGISKLIYMNL